VEPDLVSYAISYIKNKFNNFNFYPVIPGGATLLFDVELG
jgi:hypothetical protein